MAACLPRRTNRWSGVASRRDRRPRVAARLNHPRSSLSPRAPHLATLHRTLPLSAAAFQRAPTFQGAANKRNDELPSRRGRSSLTRARHSRKRVEPRPPIAESTASPIPRSTSGLSRRARSTPRDKTKTTKPTARARRLSRVHAATTTTSDNAPHRPRRCRHGRRRLRRGRPRRRRRRLQQPPAPSPRARRAPRKPCAHRRRACRRPSSLAGSAVALGQRCHARLLAPWPRCARHVCAHWATGRDGCRRAGGARAWVRVERALPCFWRGEVGAGVVRGDGAWRRRRGKSVRADGAEVAGAGLGGCGREVEHGVVFCW